MVEDSSSKKLYPVNLFLCFFVLGVFVMGFWRGCWNLPVLYVFPESKALCAGVALAVGCVINASAILLSGPLTRKVTSLPKWLFVPTSRVYMLVTSSGVVWHWFGVWILLDVYTGINLPSALACFCGGSFLLMTLRSFRTLLVNPVGVLTDLVPAEFFEVKTIFRKKPKDKGLYVVDVFVTVAIGISLHSTTWRGLWEILDLLLFPDDFPLTAIISLAYSFVMGILLVLLTPCAAKISTRLDGKHVIFKMLWEDFFLLFYFSVNVGYWRGVWYGIDILLLPDNLPLSVWISYVVGYGMMAVLGSARSLGSICFVRDGEFVGGEGVDIDFRYLDAVISAAKKVSWPCRGEKYALPVVATVQPSIASTDMTTGVV